MKVWDAVTGKEFLVLRGRATRACVWNPDSRRLASAGGGITVWDTGPGSEDLTLNGHTGEVTCAVWSPDSRHVASSSRDRTVRVWDAATTKQVRTLGGFTEELLAVAWGGDGSHLASIDRMGVVKVWDTQIWQPVATLELPPFDFQTFPIVPSGRAKLAWSADSRLLAGANGPLPGAMGCGPMADVAIWEAGAWEPVFGPQVLSAFSPDVAWSRTGQQLAYLGCVAELDMNNSSGASKSYRPNTGPGSLTAWKPGAGEKPRTLIDSIGNPGKPFDTVLDAVAWSPDDCWLAFTCVPGDSIRIRHASKEQKARTLRGHTGAVHAIAWGPDGRRLVSASDDGTVKVWDVSSGEELLTFRGKPGTPFTSVAFSPDGRRIVASQGNNMIVWDATPRD
jgi:WD40 repeat protein